MLAAALLSKPPATHSVPRAAKPRSAMAGLAAQHEGGHALPRRVLIVDDNIDAGQLTAELIGLYGAATMHAESGERALLIAPEFQPHVVFLDISMPYMDGFEVLQRLKQFPALCATRFVALTAWNHQKMAERIIAAGFDRHILKPASLQALLAELW